MTQEPPDPIQQAAAQWFARLQGEPQEGEWLSFQAWLEADDRHRLAFERLAELWVELESDGAFAAALALKSDNPNVVPLRKRRPVLKGLAVGGALAACVIVAVMAGRTWPGAGAAAFATAKGETRLVTLADGSQLTLGAATRLKAKIGAGERAVTLEEGEASFKVVHDQRRPFVVDLGEQQVRVVGTQFNIRRIAGRTQITVREGVVAVSHNGGGELRLTRGEQLTYVRGETRQTLRETDAEAAFAWREGRLVYHEAPLQSVATDLSRYGDRQIVVDAGIADRKFTGVLEVSDQATMVRRLAQFSEVEALPHRGGYLLKRR